MLIRCLLLQAALARLAARHEMLRTRFVEQDGQVLQAVLPADDPQAKLPLQRLSLPGGGAPGELERVLAELTERPHQLVGAGVPARVALVELGRDSCILQINMHHISRSLAFPFMFSCMLLPVPLFCICNFGLLPLHSGGCTHLAKHEHEVVNFVMSTVLPCARIC